MEQIVRETSRAFTVLDADTLEALAAQARSYDGKPLQAAVRDLAHAREILSLQLQAASRSLAVRRRLNANAGILTQPWAR